MNPESAIRECLNQKHSKDLIVSECKDGPSVWGSHVRMDVWVMPRSWSKPACTAYEIKVSRGDFLRDDKWPAYLDLCNSFYFVCPSGMIQPEELPESAGLMWLTKTGTRLYTKRKAPLRDVTIPENLWRYVLMCRASITPEQPQLSERKYWERWLENKVIDMEFGRRVAGAIQKRVSDEVLKVREENDRLTKAISRYERLRAVASEALGREVDLDRPPDEWIFREKLVDLNEVVPPALQHLIRRLSIELASADKIIAEQLQRHDQKEQDDECV